jgi:hypothetical protein
MRSFYSSSSFFLGLFLLLLTTSKTSVGQDLDLSNLNLQELLTACPTEIARVSPCLSTENTDISNCTGCVSNFLASSFDLNATGLAGTEACDELQSSVCNGIDECGSSCGLVGVDSWFTFGSNCEDLFLGLVACALDNYGVSLQNCTLVGASCVEEGPSDGSSTFLNSMFVSGIMVSAATLSSLLF